MLVSEKNKKILKNEIVFKKSVVYIIEKQKRKEKIMNYENLINRIKQKDNSAVMEFYNKFYKEVYYVCYKITENEKDAEDVAQETLIKAIEKIDTLKDPNKMSTWLKTIANNFSINYIKKNRKFNIVDNSEDMGEEILEENRINKKTPEDIVADKEVADILTNMINKLPREQRITIFMFYYEELSVKEIAAIMGCTEATVRSRINYARKGLRKQVDELENNGVKLRCIAILPFLFTIYSFEKAFVFAGISMPSASLLSKGIKGEVASVAKVGKVAGEATKMTLKAKIAIGAVAAVVLVGGAIGITSLTSNSGDNTDEITEERDLKVDEENDQTVLDNTEEEVEEETEGMVNWFRTAKWNEEAEGFTSNLFTEDITLPINLESIDDIAGPYEYFTDGFDKAQAPTMQEVLSDTRVCRREYKIWPDSEKDNNMHHIHFFNYREDEQEELTTRQIYDENWWCIYGTSFALGISPDQLPAGFLWGNYDAPVLDIVAEKYGAPSYILMLDVDDLNSDEAKFCLWYELVYEYDDYVVSLMVQDQPMPEYDVHCLALHQVTYYTRECWDKELEKNPIASETTINGVTCKFQVNE